MTFRQMLLLDAEIRRHLSLSKATNDDVMKRSHIEVAEALTAALRGSERRPTQWKVYVLAPRTALCRRHSSARKAGCCRERKKCRGR